MATVHGPGCGSSKNRKQISVDVPARYSAGVRLGRQWLKSKSVSTRNCSRPLPSQKMIRWALGRGAPNSTISKRSIMACWTGVQSRDRSDRLSVLLEFEQLHVFVPHFFAVILEAEMA